MGQAQVQLFCGAPDGPVRWRLLSGNNREMGRSHGSYADALAARRAVGTAQSEIAELSGRLRRVDLHRWAWEVALGGRLLVVSGHSFDRQVRCRLALEQFLAAFAQARVRPAVVVSGARRWARPGAFIPCSGERREFAPGAAFPGGVVERAHGTGAAP